MKRAENASLSETAAWYFGLSDKWGHVFDDAKLAQYWVWSKELSSRQCMDMSSVDRHRLLVSNLRAGALKLLRPAVNACVRCPLNEHRLSGRGVLDDSSYFSDVFTEFGDKELPVGATAAEIMMVAEGPGQFEQRTGNPFVTYQVLAGSMCASRCREYDNCYSPKSQMPQQPCKPVALSAGGSLGFNDEQIIQIRTDRANSPQFPIMTVAHILDKALLRAGLWREGWNGRQSLRGNPELPAKPGSIYLSNMVKCRSCKPRANGNRWEDDTPSKENMDACTEWLEIQIHIIQPSIIVAMGNPAIAGTTGINDPKVLKMRGSVYPSKLGVPVLAEVHPSFISRQSPQDQETYVDHFVGSLERAKEIASGEYVLPWMVQGGVSIGSSTSFPSPSDMEFTPTFE